MVMTRFNNMEGKVSKDDLYEVENSLNYDLEVTPLTAPVDNKTGITFRGSNENYMDAHGKLLELMNEKGERYLINGIEVAIADNPPNKPIIVEVKPKVGLTGKANLKIYDKNRRGSATILLTRAKGSEMLHVRTLGLQVIKYILDEIISGSLETKDIVRVKSKVATKIIEKGDICEKKMKMNQDMSKHITKEHEAQYLIKCTDCETVGNVQDLASHNTQTHKPEKIVECEDYESQMQTADNLNRHKANVHETINKIKCGKCSKEFGHEDDLEEHVKTIHESIKLPASKKFKISNISKETDEDSAGIEDGQSVMNRESNENLNAQAETELEQLEKKSFEERRMDHREIEVKVNEAEEYNMVDLEEKDKKEKIIEKLKVESELEQRSKMNDEKVLRKQKKIDEEFMKQKKVKQISEAEKIIEERKRKRQKSVQKKKMKKKEKQDRNREIQSLETNMKKDFNKYLVEIDEKYSPIFLEAGLDIKDYIIYKAKADGACASNCTAIHVHHDQNLGPYVRRNVNEHIHMLWPFFKGFYKFPLEQIVGTKKKVFIDEKEFLNFLKSDQTSGWMWMDHIDIQAVANIYQMKIHILTTNISGIEEPKARWTHLVPDERLKEFSTVKVETMDMFLMHVNNIHYDLIVNKHSILATEGDIPERKIRNEKESKDEINEEEDDNEGTGPGYMGWSMDENVKVINESPQLYVTDTSFKCESCEERNMTKEELNEHKRMLHDGKGAVKCEQCGKTFTNLKDRMRHTELFHVTSNESKEYIELKREFEELKVDYEKLKIAYAELADKVDKSDDGDSNLKKLRYEVKKLKIDYKQIMEAIQKETMERNNAETKLKVLKDTINAKEELKILKVDKEVQETVIESMVVDDEDWEEPRRRNRKREISIRSKVSSFNCSRCDQKFSSKQNMTKHEQCHTQKENFKCGLSDKKFKANNDLNEHAESHKSDQIRNIYVCGKCEQTFTTEEHMKKHEKSHTDMNNENDILKCTKCEKVYSTMSRLRRHDWRAHREINCNICDEKLKSREAINSHRQEKHKMLRKIACKFFPACMDEDECLYSHEEQVENKKYCTEGSKCVNQSCEYSEANHLKSSIILCKFQENCHRINCPYKHITERKAFLGVSLQNKNEK